MAQPFLSVIVPAYNEESRILAGLDILARYLRGRGYTWELVVVDDGSTDRTAEIASQWASSVEGARLLSIPHRGKGSAIRHGMLNATGQYRMMCDADTAMPVEYLDSFIRHMEEGFDIVIGSRQIEGARRFGESPLRHFLGRLFNKAVHALAVRDFQDTQCGYKCFRGDVAEKLFRMQRTDGWGFDVEVLYLAVKNRLRVLEMPIDWYHRKDSKVRPGVDSLSMLRDVFAIRLRAMTGKYNAPSGRPHGPQGAGQSDQEEAKVDQENRGKCGDVNGKALGETYQLAIVIPTYNEAQNLPALTERLFALPLPETKLIIVDDNSPDGTAEVARKLKPQHGHKLEVIERKQKSGLGTAYQVGFAKALRDGADYVLQMDADLSHAPEYIPGLLHALDEADVVVGSRYTKGGGVDGNWGLKRRLLSSIANMTIRRATGLRVKDATTGFKAFNAAALRSLNLDECRCKGFGFQAEVAYACQKNGHKVIEYPITFYERAHGKSKMSLAIILEAMWRLSLLRWRRPA